MQRRTFLSLTGSSFLAPVSTQAAATPEFDWDAIGEEALSRAVQWMVQIADRGIEGAQQALVEAANAIAPTYRETADIQLQSLGVSSDWTAVYVNSYRAITSITQTLDTQLGLEVPWPRFMGGLGKASSIGGILLALGAIGEAAVPLHLANTRQGLSPTNIETDKFVDFVFALLSLAIEIAFFAVPVSYRFAWRGTRYISTRTLFRVRKYLPNAYRDGLTALAMIILHWSQRLGVELVFANLQIGAETIAGGHQWLQRLNASVRIDDQFEPVAVPPASIWDADEAALQDAMLALAQEYPVVTQLADDAFKQLLNSEGE